MVFFFIVQDPGVNVLGFAAAEHLDDLVVLVADRGFNTVRAEIRADQDITTRRVAAKTFVRVILLAFDELKIFC